MPPLPPITLLAFEYLVDDAGEGVDHLRRSDLERFVYDPPKERVALVRWSSASSCWFCERGGDSREWKQLHEFGEVLFGPPPWRRAQVLRVFGRLGSVEACIAALPPCGPDFSYGFEPCPDVRAAAGGSRRHRPGATPGVSYDHSSRDRARWRKADALALKRRERQGSLF